MIFHTKTFSPRECKEKSCESKENKKKNGEKERKSCALVTNKITKVQVEKKFKIIRKSVYNFSLMQLSKMSVSL